MYKRVCCKCKELFDLPRPKSKKRLCDKCKIVKISKKEKRENRKDDVRFKRLIDELVSELRYSDGVSDSMDMIHRRNKMIRRCI